MSKIQWTDRTWNPTTGCDKTSSRCCKFCYAERVSKQLQKQGVSGYENGFNFTLHPERLEKPSSWSGDYVFAGSMSDLFHDRCPEDYLFRIFEVMEEQDQNVYQPLTKRSERLAEIGPYLPWGDHIWMGVSVGSRDDKGKIDDLRECGAHVKYISAEPLVEDLGDVNLDGIDWMVIGGESGPVDRIQEADLDWIRNLIEQCREQNTTPFVKQLGQIWAQENDASDTHGGHPYDWPEDLQVREVPRVFAGQPELDPWP